MLPSFTPRESDVLEVLLRSPGLTNKGLARSVHMREGTVKIHIAHVARKLGVSTKAEIVATLIRAGYDRSYSGFYSHALEYV